MTNPGPDPRWIPGTNRLAATVAVMLMVVTTQFAQAQTFSVLHSFTGLDGEHPYAGVTLDGAENLYGTTYGGGTGAGMVYKLTHQGSGWTLNSLSSFAGGGAGPYAGVIFGSNGTLYGTTSETAFMEAMAQSSIWLPRRPFARPYSAPGRKPSFMFSRDLPTTDMVPD